MLMEKNFTICHVLTVNSFNSVNIYLTIFGVVQEPYISYLKLERVSKKKKKKKNHGTENNQ